MQKCEEVTFNGGNATSEANIESHITHPHLHKNEKGGKTPSAATFPRWLLCKLRKQFNLERGRALSVTLNQRKSIGGLWSIKKPVTGPNCCSADE